MSARTVLASPLLKGAITCGLLYAIFTTIPLTQVTRAIASAKALPIAMALLLMIVQRCLGACRTKRLVDQQGISLSVRQVLGISYSSTFYGLLLPGAYSGGLVRWYKLSRGRGTSTRALAVIAFDRLADAIALVSVGLACWLLSLPSNPHGAIGLGLLTVLAGLLCGYGLMFDGRVARGVLGPLTRRNWSWVPQPIRAKWNDWLATTREFHDLSLKSLVGIAGWSLAVQLAGIVALYLFTRSLGVEVPLVTLAWVRACVQLLTMLPITFAGVGVREGGLVLLLQPYGIAGSDAVALGFLSFAGLLVAAGIGAVVELKGFFTTSRGPMVASDASRTT